MNNQNFPLEPSTTLRRPSGRCTITLAKLMDEPMTSTLSPRHTGTDTAWAFKLKACMDTVARTFHLDVISAKPVKCFSSQDSRDMLFEVDTSRGPLEVTRTRNGDHTYIWKNHSVH